MDKKTKTKIFIAAGILLFACAIFFLVFGNKEKTRVVFTKGFAKNEVFRIEDESCRLDEIMVYLATIQNQYEEVYGERIWETQLDGVTLEESVKETVLARIAQVKTMYLLAQDKGIALSEGEKELVKKASDIYYASLNEEERKTLGATPETVEKLYTEYALAEKVYACIIKDINPEISDDEARTVTVQQIALHYDVRETAEEIHAMAISGEADFAELASRYNEDPEITVSFGRGEREAAVSDAAFSLETGQISEVIRTSNGYYIFKCVSTLDREQTDVNKERLVEERRKEAFGQEYDFFVEKLAKNLNRSLWKEVTLIRDPKVKTSNFFSVYEEIFEGIEWQDDENY